jgi:hypothetical protein
MLGQVSAATNMIVGEAGKETVAVLRNPREYTGNIGGGGGDTTNINITVTGNTLSGDSDEEELANRIAYKVEQIMGRKASAQGFRFAAR